ncbi:MAG: YtxH domain-containing protein [Peptostreptococcaceae bacterium]|nr:YtxH domain-containing protein [Peptostreptococcaceae bacterium]
MRRKKGLCPFILGGLVGIGIGFLLAPKKGSELREDLFEKAMDLISDSQGLRENVSDFVRTMRSDEGEIVEQDGEIIISREFEQE